MEREIKHLHEAPFSVSAQNVIIHLLFISMNVYQLSSSLSLSLYFSQSQRARADTIITYHHWKLLKFLIADLWLTCDRSLESSALKLYSFPLRKIGWIWLTVKFFSLVEWIKSSDANTNTTQNQKRFHLIWFNTVLSEQNI